MWIFHFDGGVSLDGLGACHFLSGCVFQGEVDLSIAFQVEGDVQGAILVFLVQIRGYTDVFDALLVTSIEIAIATYTAIAEEVLVFQISAIAPTEYLESNQVLLACLQIRSQVEFGFQLAVFAITHVLSVHP